MASSNAAPETPPPRYREWAERLFEAPDLAGHVSMLQLEQVAFAGYLFRNLRAEIAPYDDEQVRGALEYVFYQHKSDIPAAIMGTCCPLDQRLAVLAAARSVYPDCFETRCEPVLVGRREPYRSLLQVTCYMLWDVTALRLWEEGREVVLDILRTGLDSPNPACVESALHGLGHLAVYEPRIPAIIDAFLARREATVRRDLADYARAARTGYIQ